MFIVANFEKKSHVNSESSFTFDMHAACTTIAMGF